MATTKGPMLSLAAAGSLESTLVFSNWKGRSTVKYSPAVTNPKTAPQVARRAMMRFLATNFDNLSDASIATWASLSIQRNISAYNAWLAYNMDRWARYKGPTCAFPANESKYQGLLKTPIATARNRTVLIHLEVQTSGYMWTYHLHRAANSGFTPSLDNTIRIGRLDAGMDPHLYWTDGPLKPGTYYYRAGTCSSDGKDPGGYTSPCSATIT